MRALDPARLLARGWTITRDADGRVVRAPHDVAPGDLITTQLAGGRIASRVASRVEDRGQRPEDRRTEP